MPFNFTLKSLSSTFAAAAATMVLLTVTFSNVQADIASLEQTEIPVSAEKHKKTLKVINYLIENAHYRAAELNDEFSVAVLNNYLKQLDPTKSFFLRQDINKFKEVENQFDDYIKEGSVEDAFAIFSIFRTRVEQRVEFALARLNQAFDFTLEEQYELDRSDSEWAPSEKVLNDIWRKRVKNDVLSLRLAGKEESEIVETLERRYTHTARRTRQFKSDDVFQTFTNAYVSTIEPHTSYFSPRASENFDISMRLSLEGIGAVLQTDSEYTLVRRIVPGGPADLSGLLHAEDRIIGVGQDDEDIVDVIGWRLDDVVDLIRGPKASTVRLELIPGEAGLQGESETIKIVRDQIKLEEQAAKKKVLTVETALTSKKIGLIDLPSFYVDFEAMHRGEKEFKSTTQDVRKLLREFESEGIDGLVIDLRGNGGGALTEAVALTGLFIRKGPVVQVENSRGRVDIDKDPDPAIVYDGPLAVLVDGYSASASEIFAGAIQDYGRGLIIGEPTFGKGTVQNLLDLNRYARNDGELGKLKVTIAQFFRVNGDSTQFRGVVPDVIWPTADPDPQFGERAYDNAIPFRHIKRAKFESFSNANAAKLLDLAQLEHQTRVDQSPEFLYYIDVAKINRQRRDIDLVSLSEITRKTERTKHDLERLDLENRKRGANDMDAFSTVEELDAYLTEKQRNADKETDAFALEAARILSDYMHFTILQGSDANSLANSN